MIHIDLLRDTPAYKLLLGIAWSAGLEKIAYGDMSSLRDALRTQSRSYLDLMQGMNLPDEDWVEYIANTYHRKALAQNPELINEMMKEAFEFDLDVVAQYAGLSKEVVNEIVLVILSDMAVKIMKDISAE